MSFYTDSYGRKHYIKEGYKRFHNMNAQYNYHRAYENDRYFDRYYFISYSSPICYAMYDSKYDSWHININWEKFDCSSSTSRQFNRWLSENYIPLTLYDVKRLSKLVSYGPIVVSDYITVSFFNDKDMYRLCNIACNNYLCF